MSIQARFVLSETTRIHCHRQIEEGRKWELVEGCRVKLAPTIGEPFGSATPGGSIEMVIANPDAAAIFQTAPIGQEFDFLITPVQESSQ
jgi:hypothetical protein